MALTRIASLYAVQHNVLGTSPAERLAARAEQSRPIAAELRDGMN